SPFWCPHQTAPSWRNSTWCTSGIAEGAHRGFDHAASVACPRAIREMYVSASEGQAPFYGVGGRIEPGKRCWSATSVPLVLVACHFFRIQVEAMIFLRLGFVLFHKALNAKRRQ